MPAAEDGLIPFEDQEQLRELFDRMNQEDPERIDRGVKNLNEALQRLEREEQAARRLKVVAQETVANIATLDEGIADRHRQLLEAEMQPEYDFTGAVRGKHHAAYQRGFTVSEGERDFVLDPPSDVPLRFDHPLALDDTPLLSIVVAAVNQGQQDEKDQD